MAGPQVTDADLVETFIGQADRNTHSGINLRNCFSRTAFDLVFRYGSVLQKSAVRHALVACLSLPAVDHLSAPSVRHATFEKHLDNLLVHALRNGTVARYDLDIANLLVETAADRTRAPMVKDKNDQHAEADIDAAVRQLEQQLKKVLGVRD